MKKTPTNKNYNTCKFVSVKIPKNVVIKKINNFLFIKGPILNIKIKTNLTIVKSKKNNKELFIILLQTKTKNEFNEQKKDLVRIKRKLAGTAKLIKKNLNIVGIGYRAFLDKNNHKTLILKLGFSHFIYIETPSDLKVLCINNNKIQITGYSTKRVNEFAKLIKTHKIPEPYKGKGIFYENEKIALKKGKKL